jgi:hypothetical protein
MFLFIIPNKVVKNFQNDYPRLFINTNCINFACVLNCTNVFSPICLAV